MKRIGFIDYYLSEWHANNYPTWMRKIIDQLGLDIELSYAYAELDVSPLDSVTTDEWCERFGMQKCITIDELCEKSDYIVILAPSNPETHLRLATAALKYGKRTYIDKTFAPDYKTAEAIFDVAREHGAPFFSTSALRYASELDAIEVKNEFTTSGGGSLFDEYIIHQCEMLVKKLGTGATSVMAENGADGSVDLTVSYPDSRRARMLFAKDRGFSAAATFTNDLTSLMPITSSFFDKLMSDILAFFESGVLPFDPEETLEVMKIREAAIKACGSYGTAISTKN